jgi:hypothetical protein
MVIGVAGLSFVTPFKVTLTNTTSVPAMVLAVKFAEGPVVAFSVPRRLFVMVHE